MTAHSILTALIEDKNVSAEFRGALTASDVLADAGSRIVPCFFVTTVEGDEIDRWKVEPITIRQHTRLSSVYSKLVREFEYDEETGEITAALIINERTEIER